MIKTSKTRTALLKKCKLNYAQILFVVILQTQRNNIRNDKFKR